MRIEVPGPRKIINNGDVLFTVPAGTKVESWWRTMRSVRCGSFWCHWEKRPGDGCGVEIGYEADEARPTRCELCGSTILRSYNVYGVMGFGERPLPTDHTYSFSPAVFESRRSVVEQVCARRRFIRAADPTDPRIDDLTHVLAGVLFGWRMQSALTLAPHALTSARRSTMDGDEGTTGGFNADTDSGSHGYDKRPEGQNTGSQASEVANTNGPSDQAEGAGDQGEGSETGTGQPQEGTETAGNLRDPNDVGG